MKRQSYINNTLTIPQKFTTHTAYSPQYKLNVLLKGFQRDSTITDLCRREGIHRSVYYNWQMKFMQGVRNRFTCPRSHRVYAKQHAQLKSENQLLGEILNTLTDGILETNPHSKSIIEVEPNHWMLHILQNAFTYSDIMIELGDIPELDNLLQQAASDGLRERNRAISILACCRGISPLLVARFLHISKSSVYRYWRRYEAAVINKSINQQSYRKLKAENEDNINALFILLHSPPSEFGINRTAWIIKDLKNCLSERGIYVSRHVIQKIIKNARYTWKKAKVVLTSNDPEYRNKLDRIKGILSSLRKDECFFSIDEFGPFSIKMKAGRRLVALNEHPSVPQFQTSKGCLILVAAL